MAYTGPMKINRITIKPGVCEGKPIIRGMRITVEFVLRLMGSGMSAEDIVREYPELELEDVYQCSIYAAWLASGETHYIVENLEE